MRWAPIFINYPLSIHLCASQIIRGERPSVQFVPIPGHPRSIALQVMTLWMLRIRAAVASSSARQIHPRISALLCRVLLSSLQTSQPSPSLLSHAQTTPLEHLNRWLKLGMARPPRLSHSPAKVPHQLTWRQGRSPHCPCPAAGWAWERLSWSPQPRLLFSFCVGWDTFQDPRL